MTKQEKINTFDPSQPGLADQSIFGLPFTADESDIVIIPVPWEVTVSYGAGASEGPEAILDASFQVDLHHQEFPELWKLGMYLDLSELTTKWGKDSVKYKALAQPIIEALEGGENNQVDGWRVGWHVGFLCSSGSGRNEVRNLPVERLRRAACRRGKAQGARR